MKKTPGRTAADREKYWVKKITEARAYPGGVTAFCRAGNISKNNYYSWFKRLRASHPEWHDLNSHPSSSNGKSDRFSTEVVEKARRRKFSAAEKARILRETDHADPATTVAILRREGVYSAQLKKWRSERDLQALTPKKRGRKSNPLTTENRKLKADNVRLEKQLQQAKKLIELQKKVSELLGVTMDEIDEKEL